MLSGYCLAYSHTFFNKLPDSWLAKGLNGSHILQNIKIFGLYYTYCGKIYIMIFSVFVKQFISVYVNGIVSSIYKNPTLIILRRISNGNTIVDARNKPCPQPVILTKSIESEIKEGRVITCRVIMRWQGTM